MYLPAAHSMQVLGVAAPTAVEYLPTLHPMQSAAVGPAAVAASEYRPLAQAPEHADVGLPPAPNRPASQAMQSAAVGPDGVLDVE